MGKKIWIFLCRMKIFLIWEASFRPLFNGQLEPLLHLRYYWFARNPFNKCGGQSASPENVQGSECSALSATTVPTVTRASKKRKINTAKAPVKLSKDEEEKAKIRKRLILLKKDVDKRSDGVKKGYYQWMDCKDCAMPQLVDFIKETFRDAADFTLPIDIIELLEGGEQIGNNIITLFLWSLYLLKEATPNKNNKTGFLNPEVITADTGMDTDINVILYLTEGLRGYDFYVASYLNSRHHALLIIFPNHGRGFILDSYNGDEKKTKEDYYLVNLVEGVVGPLIWELPVVNQQEDRWECGFYVMKWVLDFVLKYQHADFPNRLPWGDNKSLSIKEIEVVVNTWFSLWRDTN